MRVCHEPLLRVHVHTESRVSLCTRLTPSDFVLILAILRRFSRRSDTSFKVNAGFSLATDLDRLLEATQLTENILDVVPLDRGYIVTKEASAKKQGGGAAVAMALTGGTVGEGISDFGLIIDHFSCISQLDIARHAPCDVSSKCPC